MAERFSFRDKRVLLTGATGGIGSALAKLLAEQGARLVLTSRSDSALGELRERLAEHGAVVTIAADLGQPGEAERLATEAKAALGGIDVLFNVAGVGYFALMEEATEDNLRFLFEVNTFAPLVLAKALVQDMRTGGGGRIINIVSSAGRVPIPTAGTYGGSKSALAVMANTMRLELAPSGVAIINIYPGTADTAFEENALREKQRPGVCPLETCGEPRVEIAEKILDASTGGAGEVWLESEGKWLATAAIVWPSYVDRKLEPLRDRTLGSAGSRSPGKERRWRLWQLESSLACNLKCIMCPWTGVRKESHNAGIMPPEVWEALRPSLSEVRSIDFTGGGETLLQPRLTEWVGEAAAAGCETGFLTNGLLLNEERARALLDAGVTWIGFSVDGATAETYERIRIGSDFERVKSNIARIARIRVTKTPRTLINFVMMPENFHQVEDIVHLARELGVDQVNFKQCDVVRGEHGKGFSLFGDAQDRKVRTMQKALTKARRTARKLKIETTAFSFTPEEQAVCDQDPRDSVFVRHDGSVAPCINLAIGGPTTFLGNDATMPVVHYGKLPDKSLPELWETESCTFYRDRFQSRLDAYETRLGQADFEASLPKLNEALEEAVRAMPEAPEGCRVCHYLYDI